MAALQKFFSAVVWSQVLELGTNRSDFPKNGFYYAFHAENASKDITFIGATFKARYYPFVYYWSTAVPVGVCDTFHTFIELFCYCSCPV